MSKDRFKIIKGYKIDRWIVQGAMWLALAFLFFSAYSHGFDLDYFYCPHNSDGSIKGSSRIMMRDFEPELTPGTPKGYCKNPFYRETDWKNEEYLSAGEYGTKINFTLIYFIVFMCLLAGIGVNHVIHNLDYKKKEVNDEKDNTQGDDEQGQKSLFDTPK